MDLATANAFSSRANSAISEGLAFLTDSISGDGLTADLDRTIPPNSAAHAPFELLATCLFRLRFKSRNIM
jgi:hypothetical protein